MVGRRLCNRFLGSSKGGGGRHCNGGTRGILDGEGPGGGGV